MKKIAAYLINQRWCRVIANLDPDPESNFVNRPINSLRTILLGWSPNTYASLTHRITCLDIVLGACPQIVWQLLVKLLPRHYDTSSPTGHPKVRDLAPPEQITFRLVWDFEAATVQRAVAVTSNDEDRIKALISVFGTLRPASRASVIAHVYDFLATLQTIEGCEVWYALQEEAARHNYFSNSDWAMTSEVRALIA